MSAVTDAADAALLGVLQEAVPFTERPFAELGNRCGLTEDETLARVNALKEAKVIRQISAIFDTRSLGYASSLVAAKIAPERLDAAVAVINAHPGVSHNYLRNHEFNLWYTIAVPPTSRLGLEDTVNLLHHLSGAESTRLLPTLRLFKIGVRFDVEGAARPDDQAAPAYTEANRMEAGPLTAKEIALRARDAARPCAGAGAVCRGRGGTRHAVRGSGGDARAVSNNRPDAAVRGGAAPPQGGLRRECHGRLGRPGRMIRRPCSGSGKRWPASAR